MRTAIAVAALAGSALAIPSLSHKHKHRRGEVKNVHVVVETVVHTVYVTEGAAAATPAPEPVYDAPTVTTVVYEEPAAVESTPTPAPQQPAQEYKPEPAPAAPAASPAAPAPVAKSGYQAVVEEWRAKLGLKALTWSQKLESNALNCAQSGGGSMTHKLNPGTYAQVLAPGTADNFESVFVGGWLCEIPSLPGLNGICSSASQGWAYEGQTGHAEILVNPSYGSYGCGLANGIWACDLA